MLLIQKLDLGYHCYRYICSLIKFRLVLDSCSGHILFNSLVNLKFLVRAQKKQGHGSRNDPVVFQHFEISLFLEFATPIQYFEVMELKGGKPKCCKT